MSIPSDFITDFSDPQALDAYWMPYTSNRYFKQHPIVITGAQGSHFTTHDNRTIYDAFSGLWCTGMGHGLPEIVEAVSNGIANMDYVPGFQVGNHLAFEVANRVKAITPDGLDHVFFTNSGSEAADTALKMARAYWRMKGQGSKTRFIGRAMGYHGTNFGGFSVGGIPGNRKLFGQGVDSVHLPHTLVPENRFSKGLPTQKGIELADHLEELLVLHDPSNIAAVMIEPFSGSGGVILPPTGYLQRIRDICDKHNVLLIFDEVITGFGRTGHKFGADAFGVVPDIMNLAKGITNGCVPMGAVVSKSDIYQTFMENGGPDYMLEFPHGYTYSAHPVACAAALGALDVFEKQDMPAKVRAISPYFEAQLHHLKGLKHIVDIRNFGLAGALEIATFGNEPAKRPFEIFRRCWEAGVFLRCGGNTIQIAPIFTATKAELDHVFNVLSEAIQATD